MRPATLGEHDRFVDMAAKVAADKKGASAANTQRALAQFYRDLAKHMPKDRIVVVDGQGTVDEVHRRVHDAYLATFTTK